MTGGAGFIGSSLGERLMQDQRYYVTLVDNHMTGDMGKVHPHSMCEVDVTILQLAELIIHMTDSASKIDFLPPLSEGELSRRQPDATKMKTSCNRKLITREAGMRKFIDAGTP